MTNEDIFSPLRMHEQSRQQEMPDACYQAVKDVSLLFPQNFEFVAMGLADSMISDPNFEVEQYRRKHWTSEQIYNLADVINTAHAGRNISMRVVSDEVDTTSETAEAASSGPTLSHAQLAEALNQQRDMALIAMAVFAGDQNASSWLLHDEEFYEMTRALSHRLQDPVILARVRSMLRAFRDSFTDPEGIAICKQALAFYDRRPGEQNREGDIEDLSDRMVRHFVDLCKNRGIQLDDAELRTIFVRSMKKKD